MFFKRLILQLRLGSKAPLMAPRTTQSFRMERAVLKEFSDGDGEKNPMTERTMCPQDETVCRSLFTNLKKKINQTHIGVSHRAYSVKCKERKKT